MFGQYGHVGMCRGTTLCPITRLTNKKKITRKSDLGMFCVEATGAQRCAPVSYLLDISLKETLILS